jgi:GTPase SAR1 family protein
MVLNFQVWLPEGVACWMTDRKEALSVGQRVCVCARARACSHACVLFELKLFVYWQTIGAAFAAKEAEANGRKFMMGVWDTAGAER